MMHTPTRPSVQTFPRIFVVYDTTTKDYAVIHGAFVVDHLATYAEARELANELEGLRTSEVKGAAV